MLKDLIYYNDNTLIGVRSSIKLILYIYEVMSSERSGSVFLYLILAGVILGLPAIILLSNKTVISIDNIFNIYALLLLLSALQYKLVSRITGSNVISMLYIFFGSSFILMALFLSLNYFIPSGPERNEDHKIETVDYSSGNIIITFKDSSYMDDPGMRRFEQSEIEKPPVEMVVRYTTRKGLFGYPVLIRRSVH